MLLLLASLVYQLFYSRKTKKEKCDLHRGSCLVGVIPELQWKMGSEFWVPNYENNPQTGNYFMADPMNSVHQASPVLGSRDILHKKIKSKLLSKTIETKIVTQWILKQSVSYSKMRNGFSWTQNDPSIYPGRGFHSSKRSQVSKLFLAE